MRALAQQFGVPANAVTALLESNLSLESVTQLLLVSKSASSPLDDVTKLYNDSGKDIAMTAEKLDVDAKAYADKKVDKAIKKAKSDAQAAAAEGTSKAVGAAMGGLEP